MVEVCVCVCVFVLCACVRVCLNYCTHHNSATLPALPTCQVMGYNSANSA